MSVDSFLNKKLYAVSDHYDVMSLNVISVDLYEDDCEDEHEEIYTITTELVGEHRASVGQIHKIYFKKMFLVDNKVEKEPIFYVKSDAVAYARKKIEYKIEMKRNELSLLEDKLNRLV